MLVFKNVTKKFGGITALENVSFEVKRGEFVFITGASGAGKTTVLRLILAELKPTKGEVLLEGKNISKLKNKHIPKLRQQMGVVFQDYKLLDEKTVRENIEVALSVVGLPRQRWNKRIGNVLKLVGLSNRDHLFPSQLSGGELQRVSLARALVVNPKLLIADEPTGNLDWKTASGIMNLFKKINDEGKTVIVATHHKLTVEKFKKRVVRIEGGKVVSGGGLSKTTLKSVSTNVDKKGEKKETEKTKKPAPKEAEVVTVAIKDKSSVEQKPKNKPDAKAAKKEESRDTEKKDSKEKK